MNFINGLTGINAFRKFISFTTVLARAFNKIAYFKIEFEFIAVFFCKVFHHIHEGGTGSVQNSFAYILGHRKYLKYHMDPSITIFKLFLA